MGKYRKIYAPVRPRLGKFRNCRGCGEKLYLPGCIFISRGFRGKKTDGKHQTVLHYAAALPPEITTKPLEILLQKGIFVDPQNDAGQTPLFFAYGIKNKRAVNLLLNAGADLTMRDKNQMLYNQTKSVIIHPNSYKDGALSIELEN